MLRFVYLCNTKPKIQAKRMALKNEGTLIPTVLPICMLLSIQVSFFNAEITPKIKPNRMAIKIDVTARTKVLGKVSFSTSLTGFPCLVNDSLRYGNFNASEVFLKDKSFFPVYLFSSKKV